MRLGRPVEDQIGAAPAEHAGEPHDGRYPTVRLAQAPGGNHLDAKSRVAQLGRPRARLEEQELQLVAALVRSVEHRLKHRLRAAETLSPRKRYEYAHVPSRTVDRHGSLTSTCVRRP